MMVIIMMISNITIHSDNEIMITETPIIIIITTTTTTTTTIIITPQEH